jgi:hypothetical protein
MKKRFFYLFALMAITLSAQESYWTNYHVVIEPQNEATVYKLMNDYFTANQPEGITVTLYENHFNDHEHNFTHAIGFSGSLDAMGNFYGGNGGDTWKLFLVQLNQHIKEGYSSRMGTRKFHAGDLSQDYPVQKYFIVHADDGGVWDKAFETYMKGNIAPGMMSMMGNFTAGASPNRENRWVVNGFKDFKSAMGGAGYLRSDAANKANEKAWQTFLDNNGESHLVRSGLRVRVGQWK